MKEPFQGNILACPIRQRATYADRENAFVQFEQSNVNRRESILLQIEKNGRSHRYLESPSPYYSRFLEACEFWGSDLDAVGLSSNRCFPRRHPRPLPSVRLRHGPRCISPHRLPHRSLESCPLPPPTILSPVFFLLLVREYLFP